MKKETSKIERILKLILFLNVSFPRKKEDCTDYLEISDSTFYEYIKLLRHSGFEIVQNKGYYWVDIINSENELLAKLLHFDEEEAYLITNAIKQLDVSLPRASRLYRKLIKLFNHDDILSNVIRKQHSELIAQLGKAIRDKKQVLLINYSSGNSQTIKNRLVEPFDFKHDFNLIWAYDSCEGACRQFKISRIEDIELTGLSWQHEHEHHCLPVDVFRNTGELKHTVHLSMTLRAFNLLIEEYPLTEKFCTQGEDGSYLFQTCLAKYEGAARFVMGLPEDVEVLGNDSFRDFLKSKVNVLKKKYEGKPVRVK